MITKMSNNVSNISPLISRVNSSYQTFNIEDAHKISNSTDNDYLPYMAAFKCNAEYLNVGNNPICIYHIPKAKEEMTPHNRASVFLQSITQGNEGVKFEKGRLIYYVTRQCIFRKEGNEYELMYLLCLKRDYFFTMQLDNFDKSQALMVINSNFANNPDHKLMYNLFKKECYVSLSEVGIDAVFTPDVEKWCFKDFSVSFEFSTIADMKNYNKQLTKEVLNDIINAD